MTVTRIGQHRGAPALFIDDEPVFAAQYWPGWGPPTTPEEQEENRRAGALGLHVYNTAIFAQTWCGPRPGADTPYDFSALAGKFQQFLDVDPEALFHIRMVIEAPEWWRQAHPEECEMLENGKPFHQSFASDLWRREAADLLTAYIRHMQDTGLHERVIAYHPCATPWQEWATYNAMFDLCSDYSEPMRLHFRRWLLTRYGTDQALRQAWGDAAACLDTAEVPPPQVQRASQHHHFRDPVQGRWALDYFECFNELVADDIIHFCSVVKEASRHEKIVGVFYGYLMEMSWNGGFFRYDPSTQVPAYVRSGHLAVRKLLASRVVDFFSSPLAYGFRHVGGDAPFMTVHDSIKAHGKIYFAEDDSRTHRAGVTNPSYGAPKTAPEAVQILRRNFANTVCRSSAIWWAGHECACTLDEDLRACLADFRRIGDASMHLDRSSASQIAVVVDERSLPYEAFSRAFDWPGIYLQRVFGLARLGAPHDVWLLDDLVSGIAPPYRLYFFLNPFRVTAEQRAGLRAHVLRGGATVIWAYASGITDDQTFDPRLVEDLTGIRVATWDVAWGCQAMITNFEHPITAGLASNTHWGTTGDLGPSVEVVDPEATVLGIVVGGDGRCEPGVALKDMGDWQSLYVGAPNIPSQVLRGMARYAGVHIYSDHDDVLYANHAFVAVHTLRGETKRIALPEPRPVYEVFSRRQVAHAPVRGFTDWVGAGQTHLYHLGRGADLGQARAGG